MNERELMLQQGAHDFAETQVRPIAELLDKGAPFPWEVVRQAGGMGLLGIPYPASLGGAGFGYLELGLVVEQIARASMSVAAIISVHHLATESLHLFGSNELKQRLLPHLLQGEMLGAFAFTEPATGSDPRSITTTATPTPGGYQITGEKNFVSLGPQASVCIVFAKVGRDLEAFAVELPAKGFEVGTPWEGMGARGLPTAPVYLNEVIMPSTNRLGQPGQGYDILLDVIAMGKLCVAFQALGVAQRALDLSVTYANQRHAYGAPINQLQSIEWILAEMASRVEAARWLAYRSMAARDIQAPARYEAAMAKLFCSRAAVEVTDRAMQVHGAYGYLGGSEVERLYRDAKLTEIYEGVSEIQRVIIARGLISGSPDMSGHPPDRQVR